MLTSIVGEAQGIRRLDRSVSPFPKERQPLATISFCVVMSPALGFEKFLGKLCLLYGVIPEIQRLSNLTKLRRMNCYENVRIITVAAPICLVGIRTLLAELAFPCWNL